MPSRLILLSFFAGLIVSIPLWAMPNSSSISPMAEPPEKIPEATDSLSIQLSANLQTRHIWRGTLTCSAWNIQPTFSISQRNFLIGAWAAYTVDNSYAEVDIFISFTLGRFSVAILDYFCPNERQRVNRLFDFNQASTQHTIDAVISYNGSESFPIQLMASTLVYGDDLDPETNKNFYSTYLEANYTWERTAAQKFDFFAGITPAKGYYAHSFNIVNLGFSIGQSIPVTQSMHIPIFGKLIVNPSTENIFFLFGLTLEI